MNFHYLCTAFPWAFSSRGAGADITLYLGDFFKLDQPPAAGAVGRFDAVWDRAALVAVDPPTRARYAEVLAAVVVPGGKVR